MAYTVPTLPAVGEAILLDAWGQVVKDDLDFLNDEISSVTAGTPTIKNGSFETGTGADTAPSSWDLTITSGNSTAFETSAANTAHGKQAFSMTTPGSIAGGVTLESTDFIAITTERDVEIQWLMKASTATTKVTITAKFFDEAESSTGDVVLYTSSTAIPTAWTNKNASATPPASSKLMKLTIVGVDNTTAASCYFDGIQVQGARGASQQVFTSTGTFTVPSYVTRIKARIWAGAGGGGGGGGDTGQGSAGSAGVNSWVGNSTELARGGLGGSGGGGYAFPPGGGGVGTSGIFTLSNPNGFQNGQNTGGAGLSPVGTVGGNGGAGAPNNWNVLGGLGGGGNVDPGGGGGAAVAGTPNTGGGGGGGGGASNGIGSEASGGGGGAGGEYAEWQIDVLSGEDITVTIGLGGAGGAGGGFSVVGNVGAQGGSGLVIIEF